MKGSKGILARVICALLAAMLSVTAFTCAYAEDVTEQVSKEAAPAETKAEEQTDGDNGDQSVIVQPEVENNYIKELCRLIKKDGVAYVTASCPMRAHKDLDKKFDVTCFIGEGTLLAVTEYVVDGDETWLRVWYVDDQTYTVANYYIPLSNIDKTVISFDTIEEVAEKVGGYFMVESNIKANILFRNKLFDSFR